MTERWRAWLGPLSGLAFVFATANCGSDSIDAGSTSEAGEASSAGSPSSTAGTGGSSTVGGSSEGGQTSTVSCDDAAAGIDTIVCAAQAFLATLTAEQLADVSLDYSDSKSRTLWSNLPGQARAGVAMGDLSAESQKAALAFMSTVLSADGQTDLTGVRAADDYLGAQGSSMGGPGGSMYSADNYLIAVFGTPSATGDWEVTFGGHHMAYNVSFKDGVGYPIPNHLGVEPKGEFTQDGETYAPMDPEGAAMVAVFEALPDLSAAYLGQGFSDVLIGPVEYGTGSYSAVTAKYPTGSSRKGVLVSELPAATQALVTAAIKEWVDDYDSSISEALLEEYTSDEAFADTLVAWGGTSSSALDIDANQTYMRIDGPRVWIELSCQAGVVIQGKTHFHSIYRDKTFDYAGTL